MSEYKVTRHARKRGVDYWGISASQTVNGKLKLFGAGMVATMPGTHGSTDVIAVTDDGGRYLRLGTHGYRVRVAAVWAARTPTP